MDLRSLDIRELALPDVFLLTSRRLADGTGARYEVFRQEWVEEAAGRPFVIRESALSVVDRGVLRGIHGTSAGAVLLSCARGAALLAVVDLRTGSPAFGRYETVWLDHRSPAAVLVSEGLGHAVLVLDDDTVLSAHGSRPQTAGAGYTVSALDPALALPWGLTEAPAMSDRDLAAPTAEEAVAKGLLPSYADCLELYGRSVTPVTEVGHGPAAVSD
ncbi:dTDP-4-dehydrorhamnose 3,5-epimerase family protein [Streptomyces sp. NPDC001595]|uniref:dTDP-4-dehydrorhamnose 3,5-epimerase family protein n=1 Tax=Streptomyces sp. NPDC001532 TaxID=3154520 RepID=UPI00333329B4